jgi:hypothetical protein
MYEELITEIISCNTQGFETLKAMVSDKLAATQCHQNCKTLYAVNEHGP